MANTAGQWHALIVTVMADTPQALLAACEQVRQYPCDRKGCTESGFSTLAIPGTTVCFVEKFEQWYRLRFNSSMHTYPNKTEFFERLRLFRCGAPAESGAACNTTDYVDVSNWKERIGFVGGSDAFNFFEFTSSLRAATPYATRSEVIDLAQALADDIEAKGPASIGEVRQTGGIIWAWTVTERQLVRSLMRGFTICFPVALCVLLAASGTL